MSRLLAEAEPEKGKSKPHTRKRRVGHPRKRKKHGEEKVKTTTLGKKRQKKSER